MSSENHNLSLSVVFEHKLTKFKKAKITVNTPFLLSFKAVAL